MKRLLHYLISVGFWPPDWVYPGKRVLVDVEQLKKALSDIDGFLAYLETSTAVGPIIKRRIASQRTLLDARLKVLLP